uniref:Citrate synthase, CS (Fragments) n=1 Tax=Azotobacter vinelandii TaxID=354 RepID=Q9R655_AZOVI
ADKKAQLIIEGNAPVELPMLTGTVGPDVIDVRGLTGILLHRGYPIEQLAEKQTCDEVLSELGINDPQLELAMKLERNLYPNVDFYSGIILK